MEPDRQRPEEQRPARDLVARVAGEGGAPGLERVGRSLEPVVRAELGVEPARLARVRRGLESELDQEVEGALGRWYPVTKSGAARLSFWLADPHRTSVQRQFSAGTTTFEFTKNWKFTILNNENVWAKAMNRVVSEKWPVEKAVDEMLARIKEVAG